MTLPSGFHLYQVNNLNMHGMIRCMQISRMHLLRLALRLLCLQYKFSYTHSVHHVYNSQVD